MSKYCVIVPCFNEEQAILKTIQDIRSANPNIDIVAINDASSDKSKEILIEAGVKTLDLTNNLGIGGCVQTGYRYALVHGYEAAIQIDGDGQHPAHEIISLIKKYETHPCSIVIGSRNLGIPSDSTSRLRKLGTSVINTWINLLFPKVSITDSTSGFRLIGKEALELFSKDYSADYPEPISVAVAALNSFKISEIAVEMSPRITGKSSIAGVSSVMYMIRVLSFITLVKMREKN
jgi:glycosyltransferase involved in cell wall biosynthesis